MRVSCVYVFKRFKLRDGSCMSNILLLLVPIKTKIIKPAFRQVGIFNILFTNTGAQQSGWNFSIGRGRRRFAPGRAP